MITDQDTPSHAAVANPLLSPLKKIPDNSELYRRLRKVPRPPDNSLPGHEWIYEVARVEEIVVPDPETIGLARSIDMMLRRSLETRVLGSASLNSAIMHKQPPIHVSTASRAIFLSGLSGTGKTASCLTALSEYPAVYQHAAAQGYIGPVQQLVWLHAVVPGSGKLYDLALTLIMQTANLLEDQSLVERLSRGTKDGQVLFMRWAQFAKGRFLGVLFLDECQNLFKLQTLRSRAKNGRTELRLADDECLKTLLTFLSASGIAVIFAGTPDSLAILQTRFSIQQRLCSGGIHELNPYEGPKDKVFRQILLPQYMKFQYDGGQLADMDELAEVIFSRTAGIKRLINFQWRFANRVAVDKKEPLCIGHFIAASDTYMKAVKECVPGIIGKDPAVIRRYEDLWSTRQIEVPR